VARESQEETIALRAMVKQQGKELRQWQETCTVMSKQMTDLQLSVGTMKMQLEGLQHQVGAPVVWGFEGETSEEESEGEVEVMANAVDWEEEIFGVGSSSEEEDLTHGWGGPMVMGPGWQGLNLRPAERLPIIEESLYASSPEL